MNLPFYLAYRIYSGGEHRKAASRPAVLIAMCGIALGMAVILISVFVCIGFKRDIRQTVSGFVGDAMISNLEVTSSYDMPAVVVDEELIASLKNLGNIRHMQRFSLKAGVIKTRNAFQGMILKGVGAEYDLRFLKRHLQEGEIPHLSDSASSNKVLISRTMANRLHLKLGDKIDTYFLQDDVRMRRLKITGIYQTNFADFDTRFLITDLCLVNRLNNWSRGEVSGLELFLSPEADMTEATLDMGTLLDNRTDANGSRYCVRNLEMQQPQLFAWLDILDTNVWVILMLVLAVGGFTMISGLLIIIIERTSMIGLLKSLGATNGLIRHVFLCLAAFIVGRGMLIGNLLALAVYVVQSHFHLLTLDPETYYMDTVPMYFSWTAFVALNVLSFVASMMMLILPGYMVARIRPSETLRFE